jgi:hypothetical protein
MWFKCMCFFFKVLFSIFMVLGYVGVLSIKEHISWWTVPLTILPCVLCSYLREVFQNSMSFGYSGGPFSFLLSKTMMNYIVHTWPRRHWQGISPLVEILRFCRARINIPKWRTLWIKAWNRGFGFEFEQFFFTALSIFSGFCHVFSGFWVELPCWVLGGSIHGSVFVLLTWIADRRWPLTWGSSGPATSFKQLI